MCARVPETHLVQGPGEPIEQPSRAVSSESAAGRSRVVERSSVHQLPGQESRMAFFAEDLGDLFEQIDCGLSLRWGFERNFQISFQYVKSIDRKGIEQSIAASEMVQDG